jgi:hypothetical protein
MKRIIAALTLLSTVHFAANGQDEKSDKASIKSVIEKESTAFFNVDKKNWEVNWLDATYAFWSYADSTGGSFVEGSENIRKNFEEYFHTAKPSKSKIEREWLEIRMYGKGAYVRFIQKAVDDIDVDTTSETRVLEKDKEGKWKIICLMATAKYPSK